MYNRAFLEKNFGKKYNKKQAGRCTTTFRECELSELNLVVIPRRE